jgi:poly(A) polymerase
MRDILQGDQAPKDFDVATDATPMELRRVFRNSRIIGRRFRLVHVFFGDKNIECATLRRTVEQSEALAAAASMGEGGGADLDDTGTGELYIDDDNNWGTVETDAWRRDFTINALFYSVEDFGIYDYTGGVSDVEAKLIRSVGDPRLRFREDPVRMLRAVKFAARFDFGFEAQTESAMRELPGEIEMASRFRVTEEIFRILTQKNRHRGLELLGEFKLLDHIFPTWMEAIGPEGLEQVIDFFDTVEAHAREERYLPLEVTAAGLFLPMLDTVDIDDDTFQDHAARMCEEVRSIAREMDLPKRLVSSILVLLKGQLYLLYFPHRPKQVQRFVSSREFDWVWRLHDCAFGHIDALHSIQERWLLARERHGMPIGGWVDHPDRRDIFSFRGITGGGRRRADEPASVIAAGPGEGGSSGGGRRRGGRRRRRR